MNPELRRSLRYTDFLPISLTVCRDDENVNGPYSARIVDISNHGARLLMTRVMKESFHIFHSTREDDSLTISLVFIVPEENEKIIIAARPIWLDSTQMDDIKVFKMGVDFTKKIEGSKLKKINKLIPKS